MSTLFDDDYKDHARTYGTPDSRMLKEVIDAGFKPIAITVMICEETFVFRSDKEANDAWEVFKNEGWWYGLSAFDESREQYVKELYGGDEDSAPLVYWLDKNFEPK